MLQKIKTMFSMAPFVEPVQIEDGLLKVRAEKPLNFEVRSVKLKTDAGTILAYVLVESYDPNEKLFRIKLLEGKKILDQLGLEDPGKPRLPKVLRATSQHFPGYTGTTEDISEEGCRVVTTAQLELTHDIQVKIELDDPEIPPISMYADVAWTAVKHDGSFHSGLRFQSLEHETRRTIARYIKTRLAMEKRLHTLEEVDPADLA